MNLPIRINLLDWRATEREQKKKRFITHLVGAAVLTALITGVLPILYYNHLINIQRTRNTYLQDQIKIANRKIKTIHGIERNRSYIENRMQVIGKLQNSRSNIVHYLDQLAATIPDGVFLTTLTQNGKTTTLTGMAESNARVSQYMTNLDNSPWFTNPRLVVITRKGHRGKAEFTLKVDSVEPNATPSGKSTRKIAGTAQGQSS